MAGNTERRTGRGRLLRAVTVFRNYGVVSRKKFESRLESLHEFVKSRGLPATFACTSTLLDGSQKLVDFLRRHDSAIHGLTHTDYKVMHPDMVDKHVAESLSGFKRKGLDPRGFRAPYLRWNTNLLKAIRSAGLAYDSSSSVLWRAPNGHESFRSEVADLLRYYGSLKEDNCPSLPRITERIVQIPVSLPDDEILLERLGISRTREMFAFWSSMLRDSYEKRRLLVVQVHPERFEVCEDALDDLIGEVKSRNVWTASLREISSWWSRRNAAKVQVDRDLRLEYDDNLFMLEAKGEVMQSGDKAPAKSLIRLSPEHRLYGTALEIGLVPSVISSEGHPIDDSIKNRDHLIEIAERKDLLRKSLWPDGHRSAFCLSGDIDALTVTDFVRRSISGRKEDS